MPFLSINGVEVPVAVDTMTEEVREVGATIQAFSGALVRSRIATKRDIEFEIPLIEPVLSGQWERWIRGEGEAWNFTTLYGSKGTAPNSGYSGAVDAGNGPSGSDCLLVTSGTHIYKFASSAPPYTFSFWYSDNATAGTGYSHYTISRLGGSTFKWVDGVRNDAASTGFISWNTDGTCILYGGANRRFARLLLLPFYVPLEWPPDFYGTAGAGLVAAGTASPPYLTLTGDAILETTRTAMGEVSGTSVIAASGATRRKLAVRLSQS